MNENTINTFDLEKKREIEKYCCQAQSQVLYVMIVQMLGFSRESEEQMEVSVQDVFSQMIDSKLEVYGGLKLKQINRSVLLAFSDSTKAVRAALDIQMNANDPTIHNGLLLELKIAIHSGQAISNDKFNSLHFKNHINFVSDLERMVEPGHIYLSDHAYFSAGTWINEQSPYVIAHQKHGRYLLEEVKEYVEIYEITNKKLVPLKAPEVAPKSKPITLPKKIFFGIIAVIIISVMFTNCQKTTVYLVDFSQDDIYLNHNHKPLSIEDEKNGEPRKIIKQFKKGKYVVYYDASATTRYYATLNVKKGKNIITLRFRKQKLPKMQAGISLNRANNLEDIDLGNGSWNYMIYNKNSNMVSHNAEIDMSVRGKVNDENELEFLVRWRFDMDGGKVNSNEETIVGDATKTIIFHKDKLHIIKFEINIEANKARVELTSSFVD